VLGITMLGTFPEDFPKWQLPKGIFLSNNFPNVQFPKRELPKSVLAAALGPKYVLSASLGPLANSNRSARTTLLLLLLFQ